MAARDLMHRREVALTPDERPLGELVSGVTRDLGLLVRQEVELAKAELREKAQRLARGAVFLGLGAAVAYAGVLTLIAAWALGMVRLGAPAWAAVLIIGFVIAVVGAAFIKYALAAFAKANPLPRQAVASVKESVARVKEQVT